MATDYNSLMDADAEEGLLATILLKNDVLLDINISPNDFSRQSCRLVFQIMQRMYQSGMPIDLVTLTVQLKEEQKLEEAGGIAFISGLNVREATAAKAKTYAEIVKGFAQRRRLYQVCREIAGTAVEGDRPIDEMINNGMARLAEVQESAEGDNELIDGNRMMIFATDRILCGENVGLRTGFRDLDKRLPYGMRAGDLVVLAGRPSMGKTALALCLLMNVIQQQKHVLFFSLETGAESIGQRLIQSLVGIKQEEILRAKDDDKVADRVIKAADWFYERNDYISINTGGYHTPESLMAVSRKAKMKKGLDLVIIDHLQLVSAEGYKGNRLAEMTYISRKLKQMAKEMDCPVLVLSQLNRAVENRDDKHPRMSDLRESGSIEQDADIIMLLYRDGYYHVDNDDRSVEVIVAKQKDGPTGIVRLMYMKEYMRFFNEERPGGADMGTEVQMEIPL